ncbi:TM0106 family RecB-like putative nuclease [Cellulomonas shaoxiangyii]|uniref:TM0106 family RecB-like putative nuclease n=1 Tax=Cellulomonas shaoxiangyii TaxID=2566013 RepID=A0A4V1CMB0_9CELL|nr:TM0106 family RecB-like putative nuclease [Cellulomonas shaoxiangyii]QCB92315.1 TM0106 family RecB-like putative nuclease [Cellulomonas shaoxiangyii]TGY86290.1 TM0106 family RecB-like putative nuclease [Cellulomonas shaoxiangyii]
MILLDDGTLTYSASDLTAAAECEYAVLRALDARLGRGPAVVTDADAMLARVSHLGDEHEQRVLRTLVDRYGVWRPGAAGGVAAVPRPRDPESRADLEAAHVATLDRVAGGADVLHQAAFFDGRFVGRADFVVREPGPDGDVWSVRDAKLARNAQPTALLQVAAYVDQLDHAGVPVAPEVVLVLGDGATATHAVTDLVPVYRERRARLEALLDAHRTADAPVSWGAPDVAACGRCALCVAELEARRDPTLAAGVYERQRTLLAAAGITTVDALAAAPDDLAVEGLSPAQVARMLRQARLHVELEARNADPAHPTDVPWAVPHPDRIAELLPAADPGDVFFDFEGDPLWYDAALAGEPDAWGLEYLFGVVEAPETPGAEPRFVPFWAHDRRQEKQALRAFLDYLAERRRRFPGLHVYHYAAYEKVALLRLAGRHGEGEAEVDGLLREGVLVDLYAAVRAGVQTGQRSYSLKKLEPLYMAEGRGDGVTNAADSIVEYAEAVAARDAGRDGEWRDRIAAIAEYNRYDCLSTLGLRDWLLARLGEAGLEPQRAAVLDEEAAARAAELGEPDPLEDGLMAVAGPGPGEGVVRPPGRQAVALVAAALRYHQREDKPYWWGHFDRLKAHPSDWAERRNVLLADEVEVVQDWDSPTGRQVPRRVLRMTGRLEPGSDLRAGAKAVGLYDAPFPACMKSSADGPRGWCERMTVLDVGAVERGGRVREVLLVEETRPKGSEAFDALPMALAPSSPIRTETLRSAIRALAEDVATALGVPAGDGAADGAALAPAGGDVRLPARAVLDLARRVPPRTRSGAPIPPLDDPADAVDVLTRALLDLDHSYVAVQGPPGTGKTYTGARVVAELVRQGWRVGVVAQSHAVVENMLGAVAGAGVPADAIAKKAPGAQDGRVADPEAPWTWVPDKAFAGFWSAHPGGAPGAGAVLGGTAWDLANAGRLPGAPLDLLVVDEAGQLALATTFAVAGAARNLLLLGDPQQLPQVSQGTHPEPVDRSALGWLTDGHDTLPPDLGYFLPVTHRMHPELCAAVSTLSYAGRLAAAPAAAARRLDGVAPGVHGVLVEHAGNAVRSVEEADAVVALVQDLVGRTWRDPSAGTGGAERPLDAQDVLVVAPYNAQVFTVRQALDAAGLQGTRVGTVDKFQGQQAPVVVVTTAASSPAQVPRGLDFLLDRNRLNVAVSRGQWAAFVVRSTRLTHVLPRRAETLERLGAFIGLTTRSVVPVPGGSGPDGAASRSTVPEGTAPGVNVPHPVAPPDADRAPVGSAS